MAYDKVYQQAEQKIDKARREGVAMLDLSGMSLTEIPQSISTLEQLSDLNLSDNQLTALPESIGALVQLPDVDLSNN